MDVMDFDIKAVQISNKTWEKKCFFACLSIDRQIRTYYNRMEFGLA